MICSYDFSILVATLDLFNFCHISQKDGTYMSNLEGFIPKLCQMAQEGGDDERAKHLCAAGLQALSAMVSCSHLFLFTFNIAISADYCNFIS